ncbi:MULTISPECIES: glycosyl hydrolase [unclassified Streptomyces]|uniref:glycosyl hydrolase n=1 Tax=unclassified Streptomyces TaxID=2593676 RepID=UPI00225149EA|nr:MULTISPECIES: glycosyl hydrolase [unclassified Streptomyces]MCX4525863.1 glycoside hydrolase family 26 protein [Streptomyces sp. NBC_01551]MCX4543575.1 glycoside hydrolase family 26 protein [Streptomyces sp. NBC_01565]
MKRRNVLIGAAATAAMGGTLAGVAAFSTSRPADKGLQKDLVSRDPRACDTARAVYKLLAALEADARAGHRRGTIIGQHAEVHNERYNPEYGDHNGPKVPGYYYRKPQDITGKLPGFLELDLGPGYQQGSWGVGEPRDYSRAAWPARQEFWAYTNDVVDLAMGVWHGLPRPADGSYNPTGTEKIWTGSKTVLPTNGGAPAGLVGMSFHQPWPGSPVKSFEHTMRGKSPAAKDPRWIDRVLTPGTTEHAALLLDLSFLADHLGYLAAHDVPVLLRPYHEMNAIDDERRFWWAGLEPEQFVKLWELLYHYLVGSRGLHNLIFVWAPTAWDGLHGVEPWDFYPGADYVDVVGVDDYSGSPEQPFGKGGWTSKWHRELKDYGKPRILAESFHVPLNAKQRTTLDDAPWVLWTVWGDGLTAKNSAKDVERTYNDPKTVIGGKETGPTGVSWPSLHEGTS